MPKDRISWILLTFIFLLAGFLRFFRLSEMAPFDFDQEYAANFAYNVLKVYPIQLIGQNLSVDGLFMGPWYFYYLVPFFALFGLHPIGGAIGSVVVGLMIVLAYFFVAEKMFGVRVGLVAAFLRAISFDEISHDWSMVPSYSSELLVILLWYLFFRYFKGDSKVFPIIGFIFGLFTSVHPILFPFYIVFLALIAIKRKLPKVKNFLISILAFIIPLTPLLVFEILRNFFDAKRLWSLFFEGKGSALPKDFDYLHHFKVIIGEPARFLGLDFLPREVIAIPILLVAGLFVLRNFQKLRNSFHLIMFLITFLVFFGYYILLPTHISEYYFLALSSLILLYLSVFIGRLMNNKLMWPVLVLILINVFYYNFSRLNIMWNKKNLVTLYHKDKIVKEIVKRQPKEKEFFVSYIKEPGWSFGLDYLFKLYGKVPQTVEARPPIYSIVIPADLVRDGRDITSGGVGLILPKE